MASRRNVAYRKAASVRNAVSGFRKAGLWSLTIYVFQDSDFAAAMVTNIITEVAQEHNPVTPVVAAPTLTAVAMEAVPELCPPKKETS